MTMNVLGWEELKYLEYAAFTRQYLTQPQLSPVLLDIGANKGDFTDEYLNTYFKDGLAICFEPIPQVYKKLIERFKDDNRVQFNNFGLWDRNANDVPFYFLNSDYSGMSSIYYREKYFPNQMYNTTEIKANFHRLDSIQTRFPHIFYMKIDTEGADYFVLKGAKEFLLTNRPTFVQFEIGETLDDAGVTFKQIVEFLYDEAKYKVFNRNFNQIMPTNIVETRECQNFLCVPETMENHE